MTYAPTTLSIFRLTHCIRIELHAAGVSLTEQFLLAISSLSSQIFRFGRERRKLNMRDECCSELL